MDYRNENNNFLLETNGVKIIQKSSEKKGCFAENVLNSNERKLWLSDPGFPQEIVIDISEMTERPQSFKCFAWYCWQSYNSNPSLLELWASKTSTKWEKWGQFEGNIKAGIIYNNINPLGQEYNYIKIIIRESFGASNTYLNQTYLFEENPQKLPTEYSQDDPLENPELNTFLNLSHQLQTKFEDDVLDDHMDLKGKLRTQLEELQEEVRSMCSDRADSPRSIPSQFTSPIPKIQIPKKPKDSKADELLKLKKEVNSWSSCIKDLQKTVERLVYQVSDLEKTISVRDPITELQAFKEEIIEEIKTIEFGASTARESDNMVENFEVMLKEFMKNWEEKVFRPQINALAQKAERKAFDIKEDPQDIMKKLKEKIALKNELEKKKQRLSDNAFLPLTEDRLRSIYNTKRY